MICTNCGKEVKDGDLFCSGCGAKMETRLSSFHMDELKWNLDGYPDGDPVRRETSEFDWGEVTETPKAPSRRAPEPMSWGDSALDRKSGAARRTEPTRRPESSRKPQFAGKPEASFEPAPKAKSAEEARAEIKRRTEMLNQTPDTTPWEGPAWKREQQAAETAAVNDDIDREITAEELFAEMPPRPKRGSRPFDSISFDDPKGPSLYSEDLSSTMKMSEEKRKRIRRATEKKDEDFQYGSSIFSTSRGMDKTENDRVAKSFDGEEDEELTSNDFILPLNSGSIFYTGPNPDEVAARATSADVEAAAKAYAEVEGGVADYYDEPVVDHGEASLDVVEESPRERRRPAYESTNTFVLEKVDIRDAMEENQGSRGDTLFYNRDELEMQPAPSHREFEIEESRVYEEPVALEKKEKVKKERNIGSFFNGNDVDIFLEPKKPISAARESAGAGAVLGGLSLGGLFGGLRGGKDNEETEREPKAERRSRPRREEVEPEYMEESRGAYAGFEAEEAEEKSGGGFLDKLRGRLFGAEEDVAEDVDLGGRREEYQGDLAEEGLEPVEFVESYGEDPFLEERVKPEPAPIKRPERTEPAPRPRVFEKAQKKTGGRDTISMAVDDFNKDMEAAAASVTEEPASKPRSGAEKFYTFNQKSAEFQALLDQEYQRLVSRIKEESDDDTILNQLEYMQKSSGRRNRTDEAAALEELENMDLPQFKIVEGKDTEPEALEVVELDVATEEATEPEVAEPEVVEVEAEPAVETESEPTVEAETEVIAEEEAPVEVEEISVEEIAEEQVEEPAEVEVEVEPQVSVGEPEIVEAGQVDEVVIDGADADATSEPVEKTRAELLAEIFNNDNNDKGGSDRLAADAELDEFSRRLEELEEEVEAITEPTAPSYAYARAIPTNKIESEAERNPKAARAAEEAAAKAAMERDGEPKRRSTTMELSRDAYEPPVVVLEDDDEPQDINIEDLDNLDLEDAQAPNEEAGQKKVKDITYVDIFGNEEEEARLDREERSGRIKIILLDILIVILAICVVIAGILALAEDSAIAQKIKGILHMGTTTEEPVEGEGEEPGEEETQEETEPQVSPITSAIISGAVRNANIGEIAEDTALLFANDKDYGMEGVEYAAVFNDTAWYTGGDGNNVTYLPELIGTVIEYYSKLVDRYNEGNEAVLDLVDPESSLYQELKDNLPETDEAGEIIKHEITKLQIGETRKGDTEFYMLVRVAQTVSNQEDPVIETKLIRLETESNKVVIEEIVNVQ